MSDGPDPDGVEPTGYQLNRKVLPLRGDDPESIGGYALICRLPGGNPAQSNVFVASWSGKLEAPRSLRVIKTLPNVATREQFERFEAEVRTARRVSTPGIAQLLAADLEADPPYMIQEFASGKPLNELLDGVPERTLPLPDVLNLAHGLLDALEGLHAAGITHRDVKPLNIVVNEDAIVLVDLGIARHVSDPRLTAKGETVGTFLYMSPEQMAGNAVMQSDLYSWGLVVAEAALGRYPFGEIGWVNPHDRARLYAVRGVPAVIKDAVTAALIPEVSQRPGSARKLRELLPPASPQHTATIIPPAVPHRDTYKRVMLQLALRRDELRSSIAIDNLFFATSLVCAAVTGTILGLIVHFLI